MTQIRYDRPAPEGWTPVDPCPNCRCEDVRIGHGSIGTYATCQRCAWQDIVSYKSYDDYSPDEPNTIIPAGMEDADLYQVW